MQGKQPGTAHQLPCSVLCFNATLFLHVSLLAFLPFFSCCLQSMPFSRQFYSPFSRQFYSPFSRQFYSPFSRQFLQPFFKAISMPFFKAISMPFFKAISPSWTFVYWAPIFKIGPTSLEGVSPFPSTFPAPNPPVWFAQVPPPQPGITGHSLAVQVLPVGHGLLHGPRKRGSHQHV